MRVIPPCGFLSWQAYASHLEAGPLRGYWYRWNPHYRIGLRVMLANARTMAALEVLCNG